MQKEEVFKITGWAFVVISAFVVMTTMVGRHGSGPLLPSLMPYIGIPFAILFVVAQAALCLWMRSKVGFACILLVGFFGYWLSGFAESKWKARQAANPNMNIVLKARGIPNGEYDWTRHRILSAACFSGFAVGLLGIRRFE